MFKYLTFFAGQLGLLIHKDMSAIEISLPIGISFFTFQLMSYLFDIYSKKAKAQRNPLYVGLYVALFPQLIAGPIVRYQSIAIEIIERQESYDDVVDGMQRFIYGLGKKVLISNHMAIVVDNCFDYLLGNYPMSAMQAWLGAICYTLQIYFDFSGYSDMAIGLGRMFGFHFEENFNYPYIAKSVTDFWHRWHISLSTWFRDYVYIPLGGNRVKKSRWIFNLFVVWLLTGIWHGANWTFVVWGLLYFGVLLLEKLTGFTEKLSWFAHIYTMLIVTLAWVIFRADSLSSAGLYFAHLFGVKGKVFDTEFVEYLKGSWTILCFAFIGCTPVFRKVMTKIKEKAGWVESIWLLIVFVLSLLQVISASYNPFIYFNF